MSFRHGLVAVGDSITRGGGQAMPGLRMQSWALWLAEALEMPYTCLARDGARAKDALGGQLPRLRGPYDLGCVHLGVNDVRAPGFELDGFAAALREVVAAVRGCSERLLLVALPPALGVPPAPAHAIAAANAEIARLAEEHGAVLVTLETLAGPELVQPDRVHLTARGEAHIALLACRALDAAGVRADTGDVLRALAPMRGSARLRWLLTGRTPAAVRDLRRRAREAVERRTVGSG
ncbi:MAG TPA: GDSL-type esterase/lipase family protein [Solirubrobacteraceae bacterium]|nr:GDSL-type esterase/lipase family protein [Solirubrobacteraceae bacterium]